METIIKKVIGYIFISPSFIYVGIFFIDLFKSNLTSIRILKLFADLGLHGEVSFSPFLSFEGNLIIAFALLAFVGAYLITNCNKLDIKNQS